MSLPFKTVELPKSAPLLDALRVESASGARVVICLTATWAPPCKAVRQTLALPEVAAKLPGLCVIYVDLEHHAAELEQLAIPTRGVPEFRSWVEGAVLSGNAWGEDTAENITTALVRWVASLPPLPAPPPPKSTPIWAVLAVVVGLAVLVAAVSWGVLSKERADRRSANDQISKDVAESVRRSLEERRQKAPPPPAP